MKVAYGHGVKGGVEARRGVRPTTGGDQRLVQISRRGLGFETHEGAGEDLSPVGRPRILAGQVGIGRAARKEDLGGQVGVGRQVLEHRGDPHRMPGHGSGGGRERTEARARGGGLHLQSVADRQVLAEVLARHGPRDHRGVRLLQGCVEISAQGPQGEHLEDVRVGPGDGLFVARVVCGRTAQGRGGRHQPRHRLGARERGPDLGGKGRRACVAGHRVRARHEGPKGGGDGVNALVAGDPMVVGQLVAHELADQDGCSEGGREAQDGDGGVEPVALQVAQGRDEVVAEHRTFLFQPERPDEATSWPSCFHEYEREGGFLEDKRKQ